MTAEKHPSPVDLQDFALGKLGPDSAEEISSHLDLCGDCQETISQLELPDDTLMGGLRAAPEPADSASEADAIERIVSRAVADQPPAGNESFGSYTLLERIGEGGMGAVYRAHHQKLDREVALKLLPSDRDGEPERVARFEREMRAVGALEHPNVVRALDAGEQNGQHYLAMELVDGIDLGKLVRCEGVLPVAEACEAVRQAALGLAHAHAQGLVHRDIKPSNLMLGGDGVVKLLDLGLASLAAAPAIEDPSGATLDPASAHDPEPTTDASLTHDNQLFGTPNFMSPEQCRTASLTPVSDLYSLGATLYYLLTGSAPFSGRAYSDLTRKLDAIATEPAPPITARRADLPKRLVRIVERMLANTPEERFQTANEVAEALAPLAAGADLRRLADHNQPTPATQGRGGSAWRWLVATALGAGAAAIAFALTITTPSGTLEIRVPDGASDDLRVTVRRDGATKIANAAAGWSLSLREGKWDVELTDPAGEFEIKDETITIRAGEEQLVQVVKRPALEPEPNTTALQGGGVNQLLGERRRAKERSRDAAISELPPLPAPIPQPAFELANPLRAEWDLQCDLYTKAYRFDQEGRAKITNLSWRVQDRYVGRGSDNRTLVDERIALVLVDNAKGFWPLIAMMTIDEAERLSEEIRRTVSPSARRGVDDSAAPEETIAFLSTASYEVEEFGRVRLPRGVKWKALPKYSGPAPDEDAETTDPRPTLLIEDKGNESRPLVVVQSVDATRRLRVDLNNAIKRKKSSMRQRVALRTTKGFYVGARLGGGDDVTAEDRRPGSSEVFTLKWLDAQRSRGRLRTREGFYLHAVQGGGGGVDAREKEPKSSEAFDFEWLDVERTRARLRTRDGYYVQAEGGGNVDARSQEPTGAAVFTVVNAP